MSSADQKIESWGVAFIPAALDDSDLTPNEFRVYCAILRRGNCFESLPNLARRIRLHPDTVRAILKSLAARGAIVRTDRSGQTNLFSALPVSLWTSPLRNEGVSESKGYPSKPDTTQPLNPDTTYRNIRDTHPPETKGDKGSPIEGSPIMCIPDKGAQRENVESANVMPCNATPKLEDVLAEAKSIGLAEWRATDWFNEMEGCGWIDANHQPIRSWRVTLDFIRFKWEMDGRKQSPGNSGSNPVDTEKQPKVNQKPTTQDKQKRSKPKANA